MRKLIVGACGLVAMAGAGAPAVTAQEMMLEMQEVGRDVGTLTDVSAWVNVMDIGGVHTLIVVGEVTAPTPCYTASATFAGLDKSNPPVYLVHVALNPPPSKVICIQKISDVPFRYEQPNYAEMSEQAKVSTDQYSVVVGITIAQ